MKFGPYSFDKEGREGRGIRGLAVPALVAAAICAGLTFFWMKYLRAEPEKPSEWVINWVELTNFKKDRGTAVPAVGPAGVSPAASGGTPGSPTGETPVVLPSSDAPKAKEQK